MSQIKKEISLDEGTTINENISLKDKTIENSIKKISNKNTANNEEKEYNSDKKVNEFDANDIELEDINYNNRSAKKLSYELIEGKSIYNRRKFNTVKLESYKIIDFFEKWKNAYLQRALKK